MNASELKYQVERAGHEPYFFTRNTMKFFGDTMRNYGVRSATITTNMDEVVECWELYRRRPVKHGLKNSAYFTKNEFRRVFPKQEEA